MAGLVDDFVEDMSSPEDVAEIEVHQEGQDDLDAQQQGPHGNPPTNTAQDWQLVEDDLLSQCGSSPRSLSVKDLDSLEHGTADDVSEEDAEFSAEDEQGGADGVLAALERGDIPTSSNATVLASSDTEEPGPVPEVTEGQHIIKAVEQGEDADHATDTEEGSADTDDRRAYLSGQSSYADVSTADSQHLPSETVNQELVDSLSASVISEMIAAADAASDSELGSDAETHAIPDTGVFSIATGYPLETLLFRGQTPALESGVFGNIDFGSPRSASVSTGSLSSTAADSVPQLEPETQEVSKWSDWLQSSGNTRAAKVLHRIWHQLQVFARRAGDCIPFSLRRRLSSILRCIDTHVSQGGKRGAYVAYGAAFVGFVLAMRYYRECRRLHQLNVAQKDAFDMHVLKVLDLNEKLGRGMNIPITYNCGFKDLSFTKRSYSARTVAFPHSILTAVP